MEREREPGSAKYGNFINYYTFNPPERRIKLLPADLLTRHLENLRDKRQVFALDVGCNTGALTTALYNHFTATNQGRVADTEPEDAIVPRLKILGTDIDPLLVTRATETNKFYTDIVFKTVDVMAQSQRTNIIEEYLTDNMVERFDVAFLFSVSMWIHLNHGDEGLRDFLRYTASISSYIVFEPQPWKCYTSAVRRMKKLVCQPFKHFDSLVWRQDVNEKIIEYLETSCSMKCVCKFGETEWMRPILLFAKL